MQLYILDWQYSSRVVSCDTFLLVIKIEFFCIGQGGRGRGRKGGGKFIRKVEN